MNSLQPEVPRQVAFPGKHAFESRELIKAHAALQKQFEAARFITATHEQISRHQAQILHRTWPRFFSLKRLS